VELVLVYGVPLVEAGAAEDKLEVAARVGWSGVDINLTAPLKDNPYNSR
jgi:hypothetical protein